MYLVAKTLRKAIPTYLKKNYLTILQKELKNNVMLFCYYFITGVNVVLWVCLEIKQVAVLVLLRIRLSSMNSWYILYLKNLKNHILKYI